MKKPLFIITEVFLSVLFTASAAAVAIIAVDLKTNIFHIDELDPFHLNAVFSQQSSNNNISYVSESSKKEVFEIIVAESIQKSKVEESSKEKDESSKSEAIEIVSEPENQEKQPEELVELLKAYEYSFEENLYGNKLILVEADNASNTAKAKIYCYQKSDKGYWWNISGDNNALSKEAYIGENGSGYEIKPDLKKTPAGIWTAGEGFYIDDKPDTDYPMFQITEDTYWVTDEKSRFFNKRVEGIGEKDWSTAEHMIASEKSYKYGLVINYNTEQPEAGKGSAIFMHCGTAPTEGCVAVPENVMKTILEWLDGESVALIWVTV